MTNERQFISLEESFLILHFCQVFHMFIHLSIHLFVRECCIGSMLQRGPDMCVTFEINLDIQTETQTNTIDPFFATSQKQTQKQITMQFCPVLCMLVLLFVGFSCVLCSPLCVLCMLACASHHQNTSNVNHHLFGDQHNLWSHASLSICSFLFLFVWQENESIG